MKGGGDLSEKQRAEIDELTRFEALVDTDPYANERKAQLYTMLAHDWYQLDLEEEGSRLILKAESICPGYFNLTVIQHQVESPGFDAVIKRLTFELIYLLTDTLRNK